MRTLKEIEAAIPQAADLVYPVSYYSEDIREVYENGSIDMLPLIAERDEYIRRCAELVEAILLTLQYPGFENDLDWIKKNVEAQVKSIAADIRNGRVAPAWPARTAFRAGEVKDG